MSTKKVYLSVSLVALLIFAVFFILPALSMFFWFLKSALMILVGIVIVIVAMVFLVKAMFHKSNEGPTIE